MHFRQIKIIKILNNFNIVILSCENNAANNITIVIYICSIN